VEVLKDRVTGGVAQSPLFLFLLPQFTDTPTN